MFGVVYFICSSVTIQKLRSCNVPGAAKNNRPKCLAVFFSINRLAYDYEIHRIHPAISVLICHR